MCPLYPASSPWHTQLLGDQHLLSREHEIEEKVRKKIALERVLEEKTALNERFGKLKVEMDMVELEQRDRVEDSAKYVAKALSRNITNPLHKDALKKGLDRSKITSATDTYMSEEDKLLLGQAMLDNGVQDQREKELVLKEIQARREQEKRKVQL